MAHAVERRRHYGGAGSDPDPPLRLGESEVASGTAIHGGAAAAAYSELYTPAWATGASAGFPASPMLGCLRGCFTVPGHRGCPAMLGTSSCLTVSFERLRG